MHYISSSTLAPSHSLLNKKKLVLSLKKHAATACNPGSQKQVFGRKDEGKQQIIQHLLEFDLLGLNPLQKVAQMQLFGGNSPPNIPFCSNSPCQHPPATLNTPVFLQVHLLSKSTWWHLQRKLPQLPICFFICLLWPFPSPSSGPPLPSPLFLFFSPNGTGHLSVPNYAQTMAVAKAFFPYISHHLEQSFFFLLFLSASLLLHLLSNLIWKHLMFPCLCLLISLSLCYYVLFNFDKYLGMPFVWNKFY